MNGRTDKVNRGLVRCSFQLQRGWRMRPFTHRLPKVVLGLSDNPAYQWWRDDSVMQPDSWWGAAPEDDSLSAQVSLMHDLGVTWFRMEAPWRAIAPNQPGGPEHYDEIAARDPSWPGYRWQPLDRALALLSASSIMLLPVIVFAPTWAAYEARVLADAGRPLLPSAPPRPDYWHDFVIALMTRYASRIRAVEIWNEPDHPHFWSGSVEDYVHLVLRPGADAVRAVAPRGRVVLGGLASAQNLEAICESACPSDFDIASIHVYPVRPRAEEVRSEVRTARALLQLHGYWSHAVWVTEWGVATQPPSSVSGFGTWTSERKQAKLVRTVNASSDADALFYYQLRDSCIFDGQGRILKEVYWGLVTRNLDRRKPAFGTITTSLSSGRAAQSALSGRSAG